MIFFAGITDLNRIHKWYLDLADYIEKLTGGNSTAAKLLRYYLSPKEQKTDVIKNDKCIEILKNGGDRFLGTYLLNSDYLEKVKKYSNYNTIIQKDFIPVFYSEKDKNKGILTRLRKYSNEISTNNIRGPLKTHWNLREAGDLIK